MADTTKYTPINGTTLISDLKSLFSLRTKRTVAFAYGFMFAFVLFTIFLTLNPSTNSTSPWFSNIFTTSSSSINSTTSTPFFSKQSNRSNYPSILSYFFPNSTQSLPNSTNITRSQNTTFSPPLLKTEPPVAKNQTQSKDLDGKFEGVKANQSKIEPPKAPFEGKNTTGLVDKSGSGKGSSSNLTSSLPKKQSNATGSVSVKQRSEDLHDKIEGVKPNQSKIEPPKSSFVGKNTTGSVDKGGPEKGVSSNSSSPSSSSSSLPKKQSNVSVKQGSEDLVKGLMNCNLFDGDWVRDNSYPLYKPGSCSLIDEQFNCFRNGRPDKGYQQFKWKPKGCTLPRLDGGHMLELLRGKRLVFVGDSLNRNMWESLICILRNSVKDQRKVYEASGRHHFRSEASYSFVFKDYNCTVEFFVSPFLVHEWEIPEKNGKKKETLRLDLIGGSAENYKSADIIIFNTGHWWTHDKTSKGKDYYQEGSHVYGELNVLEAFRKALTTWARWVDAKVNPSKSLVFFRGYSASHFSGGQWNSGGQCDHETEPIKNHTYLSQYPPKMRVLEKVLKNMKTPVSYLNITRLTDYRKDGHPSVYRKLHYTDLERKSPQLFQDCSHWCLPGVPDAWNEILYAELLVKQYQNKQHQQQKKNR